MTRGGRPDGRVLARPSVATTGVPSFMPGDQLLPTSHSRLLLDRADRRRDDRLHRSVRRSGPIAARAGDPHPCRTPPRLQPGEWTLALPDDPRRPGVARDPAAPRRGRTAGADQPLHRSGPVPPAVPAQRPDLRLRRPGRDRGRTRRGSLGLHRSRVQPARRNVPRRRPVGPVGAGAGPARHRFDQPAAGGTGRTRRPRQVPAHQSDEARHRAGSAGLASQPAGPHRKGDAAPGHLRRRHRQRPRLLRPEPLPPGVSDPTWLLRRGATAAERNFVQDRSPSSRADSAGQIVGSGGERWNSP